MRPARQLSAQKTLELYAGSRFGRFRPEEEQAKSAPSVSKDEMLEKLLGIYLKNCHLWGYSRGSSFVRSMARQLERLDYHSDDVERLCVALADYQDVIHFYPGATNFINFLIENGKDERYIVPTSHFNEPLNTLFNGNNRNVVLKGDCASVANHMRGGRVEVLGNVVAPEYRGRILYVQVGNYMSGGELVIHGDAACAEFGNHMRDGVLRISGHVSCTPILRGFRGVGKVGAGMTGGEIHIDGELKGFSVSNHEGRKKIYHKGELILGRKQF